MVCRNEPCSTSHLTSEDYKNTHDLTSIHVWVVARMQCAPTHKSQSAQRSIICCRAIMPSVRRIKKIFNFSKFASFDTGVLANFVLSSGLGSACPPRCSTTDARCAALRWLRLCTLGQGLSIICLQTTEGPLSSSWEQHSSCTRLEGLVLPLARG